MKNTFLRALVKGIALFAAVNLLFNAVNPLPALGRISIYNTLVPGRTRLPYADDPALAYNLTLDSLDAMFASHALARAKAADEYRVVVIGDSATWGWFLKPHETLTGQLNAQGLRSKDGRRMVFYNLGYPIMSLTKDLLILNRALAHKPDLIVWAVTLESFPINKQDSHPLVSANWRDWVPAGLSVAPPLRDGNPFEDTLIARRRDLADIFRLQAYGVMWAATGIDQHYPADYERAAIDLERSEKFGELEPPTLSEVDIAWHVIDKGVQRARAAGPEIVLLNEPILVSNGRNSDVRYNFFYPRWAYDQYRAQLQARATALGVPLFDAWNLLPQTEFTNSAVHTTPAGAAMLARALAATLQAAR